MKTWRILGEKPCRYVKEEHSEQKSICKRQGLLSANTSRRVEKLEEEAIGRLVRTVVVAQEKAHFSVFTWNHLGLHRWSSLSFSENKIFRESCFYNCLLKDLYFLKIFQWKRYFWGKKYKCMETTLCCPCLIHWQVQVGYKKWAQYNIFCSFAYLNETTVFSFLILKISILN